MKETYSTQSPNQLEILSEQILFKEQNSGNCPIRFILYYYNQDKRNEERSRKNKSTKNKAQHNKQKKR